jgi:hypothetical protein
MTLAEAISLEQQIAAQPQLDYRVLRRKQRSDGSYALLADERTGWRVVISSRRAWDEARHHRRAHSTGRGGANGGAAPVAGGTVEGEEGS